MAAIGSRSIFAAFLALLLTSGCATNEVPGILLKDAETGEIVAQDVEYSVLDLHGVEKLRDAARRPDAAVTWEDMRRTMGGRKIVGVREDGSPIPFGVNADEYVRIYHRDYPVIYVLLREPYGYAIPDWTGPAVTHPPSTRPLFHIEALAKYGIKTEEDFLAPSVDRIPYHRGMVMHIRVTRRDRPFHEWK